MARNDTDGDITIGTNIDTNGVDKGLKKINKSLNTLKGLVATVFAADVVVNFGKAALKAASDLQEVQNVINVAFSQKGIEIIEKFSKAAVETFGMSEFTAKKTAGAYAAMGTALGLVQEDAEDMAVQLTALSGDMASFWNLTQDETYTALASVYTGETETLKRYGIVLTEANLQQYAYSKGIDMSVKKMDAATKTMLRYNYVIDQTKLYQNDFVRTQENWANQIRVLQEHWNRLMIALGNGLITVLNPLLKVLNLVIEKLIIIVKTLGMVLQKVFNIQVQDISKQGLDLVSNGISNAADAEEDLGDAVSKTNKKLNESLASFDEINVLAKQSADTATSSSGNFGLADLGMGVQEPYDIEKIAKDVQTIEPPQRWIDFFTNLKELLLKSVEPLQRLRDQLDRLKTYTFKGLQGFYDYFLKPVGTWTLGEGLPRLIDILANGLSKIDWQSILFGFDNLWESLAPFVTDILGEGLLWLLENVLVPLAVWAMNNVVPPVLDSISGILDIITATLKSLEPLATAIFNYVLKPLAEKIGDAVATVLQKIADTLVTIGDWMNNHPIAMEIISTMLSSLVLLLGALKTIHAFNILLSNDWKVVEGTATGIFSIFLKIKDWITKLPTLVSGAATAIKGALSFLLSPQGLILVGITAVIAGIVLVMTHLDDIKAFLSKAASWLNDNVFEPIKTKFEEIKTKISDVWENVKQVTATKWDEIKEGIATKIELVKNIFAPITDWFRDKWDSVKQVTVDTFTSIKTKAQELWDGITGIFNKVVDWVKDNIVTPVTRVFRNFFQGILNFGIGVINKLIDGINALINKISESKLAEILGDVVGIDLKDKIPNINHIPIPQLAKGAVIPPNKAFMAVLGDQTSGTNIEAPADLIRSIVREEIANQNNNQDQKITIEFKGTMAQFVRALNPEIKREQRRQGNNLITGGTLL